MNEEVQKLILDAANNLILAADRLTGAATLRTVSKEDEIEPSYSSIVDAAVNYIMQNDGTLDTRADLARLLQKVYEAGYQAHNEDADRVFGQRDIRYPRPNDPPIEELFRAPERFQPRYGSFGDRGK